MKKLAILFFLLPALCFGQSKFTVGINFGGKLGKIKLSEQANSSISQSSKIKAGYSLGVYVSYPLTEKIFIRSGFGYENSRFDFQTEGVLWGNCIDEALAAGETPKETNYYDDISIKSVIVPIDFGYVVWEKEGGEKLYFGIGGQYNGVLKTSLKQLAAKEGTATNQETFDYEMNASPFSGKLFLGFQYPYSKYQIYIEPSVKFTPNEFTLFFLTEGSSLIEPGLQIRFTF